MQESTNRVYLDAMKLSLLEQGNRVHFTSLGCARNLVDTEVMMGILLQEGYELTADSREADFLVVNTCGFLEASREESLSTIGELMHEKKKGAKLIVAGCMVQKHKHEIQKRFSDIHYFLGSGDVEKILEAIRAGEAGEAVTTAKSFLQWGEVPRQTSTPKHYAYLKIAEGCAKRCAFCIIPTIKGPLRSKSIDQVMKEFQVLLNQGVFEVILIAQDLGDYGKERKESGGLENLLREMLKVKKNFWLRLLYLYPDEITDDLIAIIKSDRRICPYLDMPIQHINDEMLKAMRRKTSKQEIISILLKLRREIPEIVIRTSLMVGFPGETEDQFQELISFIQEYPLDNVGIFKFSSEAGASAAKFPHQVPEEEKERRYQMLAQVQMAQVNARSDHFIGKKFDVIVEGYHRESNLLMRGRFYGQCPEIDGEILINDGRKVTAFGKVYEVEITDAHGYDLIGRVLKSKSPARTLALV